jgi:TrmH family RNA methyltransferase
MKEKISSFQNPKIKEIIKLKKSRERKKQGLFLIEGRHEISLAIQAGIEIKQLFICSKFSSDDNFVVNIEDYQNFEVSEEVFRKLSYRENPDGYLAVAQKKDVSLKDIKLSENPLVVILDSVEKPGNIGAIMRSMDAVGADVLVLDNPRTDIYNPNVIRSSLGTVFTKPVVESNFMEINAWIKENGINLYTLSPDTENNYLEADLTSSTALLLGAEHEGVSPKWLNSEHKILKIEMAGAIDSLNVSVSAAVVLFEAARQRRRNKA